jgi:hypothetical protein
MDQSFVSHHIAPRCLCFFSYQEPDNGLVFWRYAPTAIRYRLIFNALTFLLMLVAEDQQSQQEVFMDSVDVTCQDKYSPP